MTATNDQSTHRLRLKSPSQTYEGRRFRHLAAVAEREHTTIAEAAVWHPERPPRGGQEPLHYPGPMFETGKYGLPLVPVTTERAASGVWLLWLAVGCPYCNRQHGHGGGDGERPFFGNGIWVTDCTSEHRAFRADCRPQRSVTGRRRMCPVQHGGQYELYLPEAEAKS